MPSETGIWSKEEAMQYHVFDYKLAQWIGQYLYKNEVVIDVGCGRATLLRYLHDIGFETLSGIDGSDQVFEFGSILDNTQLSKQLGGMHIPSPYNSIGKIAIRDLSHPIILKSEYPRTTTFPVYNPSHTAEIVVSIWDHLTSGHVICMEVGEHIPIEYAHFFMDNIAKLTAPKHKLILTWAIPGQDGIGHVNCQHNIWVINEIRSRGFFFLYEDSMLARQHVSNYAAWFRNTILVFEKQPDR